MGYLNNAGLSYFFGKLKTIFAPISHGHGGATQSAAGFMSAADKKKLDGIAEGANKYALPTATSSVLGGVKTGANITNSSGTISLTKANVTTALGYTPPTSNTWRGVQNNLTSTATDQSLAAFQGKVLNETKAAMIVLTNENLNNITTPGFYSSGCGNSVTNKPSGVEHFGLVVIHRASGAYYTQIIYTDSLAYRRHCINGTWGNWTQDKLTDTNTWRGIQDNLTSDSAADSLSAKQGKALKTLVDGKAPNGHIHLNGTKSGNVNWNTLVTYGSYKIQNCTMTAGYNAPVNEYSYGILEVIDGEGNAGEHRLLQIYHPHNTTGLWYRMNNSSKGYTAWTAWAKIAVKPATAGTADVAKSVDWGNVANKPSTFTPSSHTHDLNAMINTLSTGTSTPADADYYISQYVGGGTTITTYHRRPMSALWAYVKSKADSIYAASGHTHKSVIDNGNGSSATTFAYSKSGMNYGDYTWMAAWNGYELRAVNKNQFAQASHTHAYLPLSGGTVTGVTAFTNTTASTNKSTGAVKVSGGVGVAGRMSANEVMIGDGCTLMFDSTNKCVDFVFS